MSVKKIFIGVLGVTAVAAGGVCVAVNHFLDSETIAREVKDLVSERYNRELVFNGELKTTFFPKVQIVLPETTLSHVGQKTPQLTLDGASVGVAVLPLLKGNIQFDAIEVRGLKGTVNAKRFVQTVDNQKATDAKAQEVTVNEGSAGALPSFIKNLKIANVTVKDCALTVYGLQDQKVYSVSNLSLETGEIALAGTTPVKIHTDFAEKTQAVSGSVDLKAMVTYEIQTLALETSDLETKLVLKQKDTETGLEVYAKHLAYTGRDVEVDTASALLTQGAMTAGVSAKRFETSGMQKWTADDVKFIFETDKTHFVNLGGYFTGTLDGLTLTSNDLDGRIDTTVNGRKKQIPFKGYVSADVQREKASLTLSGKLDESDWKLAGNVAGFNKPDVTAEVTLARFVVDDWLALEAGKAQKTAALSSDFGFVSRAWAATPARIEALNAANAHVRFAVDEVRYKALPVKKLSGAVKLQKGVLSLANTQATVADGRITANATLNADQKWTLSQNATGVKVDDVLAGLQMKPMLTGTVEMTTKLSGLGLEETAIKKTAAGSVTAEVKNAVLQGISLERVAKAVRDKDAKNLVMQKGDSTVFTNMRGVMTVKDGVVTVNPFTGQSAVASVNGQVKLGLIDESIAGTVSATLATSAAGRQVTVPIALSGALSEPQYGIDVASAIKANLSQEVKAKAQEKIEEKLGKLFDRLNRK